MHAVHARVGNGPTLVGLLLLGTRSYAVQLSILTRSNAKLSAKLTVPGESQAVDLPALSGPPEAAGKYTLYAQAETTERGTTARHYYLIDESQKDLPKGSYTLELSATEPVEVDIYVGDIRTSWGGGFSFTENTSSRTICHPATADSVITVAAFILNDDSGFNAAGKKGEIASYSSRGPTLMGSPGIEVAAPDNPPGTSLPNGSESNIYEPFGGTSGAGPHVAAGLALLALCRSDRSACQGHRRRRRGRTKFQMGPRLRRHT
jgi:Subtilase family